MHRALIVALLPLALASCGGVRHVEVLTVLSLDNCQTNVVGLREIDYPTLAAFRGTRLLGMSESPQDGPDPLHLVAILPGQYRTAGYGVRLVGDPELTADRLTIHVEVTEPPTGAATAQMLTRPCLVVGVSDSAVHRVRVVDAKREIGELQLSQGRPEPVGSPPH